MIDQLYSFFSKLRYQANTVGLQHLSKALHWNPQSPSTETSLKNEFTARIESRAFEAFEALQHKSHRLQKWPPTIRASTLPH